MNNKIKKSYECIEMSKNNEEVILNKTVYKGKKIKKHFKYSYALSFLVVMCLLSFSIVNADKIKNAINNWRGVIKEKDGNIIELSKNNGYKEIPVTAPKVKEKDISINYKSFKEIEKVLGFKVLKPLKDETDIFYDTRINSDNSIGIVDLWIPNYIEENTEKNISVRISIPNKYIDKNYYDAFSGDDDATEKESVGVYKSDNLKVNIAMWDSSNIYSYPDGIKRKHITAVFVYDDIKYWLGAEGYSKEEVKEIIENLQF